MKLNLGCSDDFKKGYLNVDSAADPRGGVHADYLQADLNARWPWPDGTVDEIIAHDVFEHIGSVHWGWYDPSQALNNLPATPLWKRENVLSERAVFDIPGKIWAMNEAHRVLKAGGILDMTVPCVMLSDGTVNPGAFADPTHRSYWTFDDAFYYATQFNTAADERGRLGGAYGITALFEFPCFEYTADGWGTRPQSALKWSIHETGRGQERRAKIVGRLRAVK